MIHAAEPSKLLEKLIAKSRLQPLEILTFWRPLPGAMKLPLALLAECLPLTPSLTKLDATAHKVPRLNRERKMGTLRERRRLAKRTVLFPDHACCN